jgi:hypothetical protein
MLSFRAPNKRYALDHAHCTRALILSVPSHSVAMTDAAFASASAAVHAHAATVRLPHVVATHVLGGAITFIVDTESTGSAQETLRRAVAYTCDNTTVFEKAYAEARGYHDPIEEAVMLTLFRAHQDTTLSVVSRAYKVVFSTHGSYTGVVSHAYRAALLPCAMQNELLRALGRDILQLDRASVAAELDAARMRQTVCRNKQVDAADARPIAERVMGIALATLLMRDTRLHLHQRPLTMLQRLCLPVDATVLIAQFAYPYVALMHGALALPVVEEEEKEETLGAATTDDPSAATTEADEKPSAAVAEAAEEPSAAVTEERPRKRRADAPFAARTSPRAASAAAADPSCKRSALAHTDAPLAKRAAADAGGKPAAL